ncbi:MAG: UDP-2,3-diacylglucosamine hydrolase [Chlamydiales bacterium]|jgi:UDP-2,3-diacylglucosamine hydrolase
MTRSSDVPESGRPQQTEALEHGTLVIADLHLDPSGDARVDAFVEWVALSRAPHLIILGDLFDVWVGPAQSRMGGAGAVMAALAMWTARGAILDVVPGNRDFLLGSLFMEVTGARLRPEGFVARASEDARRILFIHGDELCTRDIAYQRMKRILRSRSVRILTRWTPLPIARWAAARLRQASVKAIARKPAPEKAMQTDACREIAAAANASVLICGHAHEFRDEAVEDGPRWIVLDAWGGARDVLAIDRDGRLSAERGGCEAGAIG